MAPQQRRAPSRRLAVVAAAVATAAALASGPGFAAGAGVARVAAPVPAPAAANPAGAAAKPAPPAPSGTAFGAYLDYGSRGVARIAQLSKWLDGADLRVGHTYLPGDRWSSIEGPPGFLDVWANWRNGRDDRMLVLNVPMLERNEADLSDRTVRRLLRLGADGRFDHHFRRLAERLVGVNAPDTVIVLGWEMNGITYTHRCGPDPEAWKAYWKRIVTTMRAVPGQKFKFDFAPSRGRDAVPWTQCYPGNDTVDVIGMDSYDQPAGISFDQQVTEPYGLQAHVDFAKSHGKPISYPEWGLFRNGDNPGYMRSMLAWMDRHRPLYNTLTDYCPHGVWQCGQNPQASRIYRSLLSGRTGGPDAVSSTSASTLPDPTKEPAPEPTAEPTVGPTKEPAQEPVKEPAGEPVAEPAQPPAPATPAPQPAPTCAPLGLSEWIEHWVGGKLCVRLDRWSPGR
ncbi:glycosyl hydrolase [Streptomyces sp. NPDC002328]|uniref:glycosyl hydrolase n=1 Tax=Streptomyces sp. NPDC002328 TaxID=3364642 RepID=UPI003697F590